MAPATPILPTLRAQLLRQHLAIGVFSACIIMCVIGVSDYLIIRRTLITDIADTVDNVVQLYVSTSSAKSLSTNNYLEAFDNHPGIELLCVYDADGNRLSSWQLNHSHPCPNLLIREGVEAHLFDLKIAEPIRVKEHYLGMVYAEATLRPMQEWLRQMAFLFVGLCTVIGLACVYATRRISIAFTIPLQALREQIECLKESEGAICQPRQSLGSSEMQETADALTQLREHLSTYMIKRDMIGQIREWHWSVLSGLISDLRQRISADSPLLDQLNDYALLLETERINILPPPQTFSLNDVVARALAGARRIYPRNSRLNLTVSVQSRIAQRWSGHGEMVEALLRHLMIIGLERTRSGFVFLRLEVDINLVAAHTHTLRILYEDSAPAIQPGQLQQILSAQSDSVSAGQTIGWLLVPRLFRRLGGSLISTTHSETGLMLEGKLPLSVQPELRIHIPLPPPSAHTEQPLILAVEQDKEHAKTLARILADAKCRVLIVEAHAQAIELAPLLPISAIILNNLQPDAAEDIPLRLRHMMEDGLIPEIPIWLMVTESNFFGSAYWQQRNITELLLKPLRPQLLQQLCDHLKSHHTDFYLKHDEEVRDDLSPTILSTMPIMNQMLGSQLDELKPLLTAPIRSESYSRISTQAHAVKSAALTLGYLRLAALMDVIEHARSSHLFTSHAPNGLLIAELLEAIRFDVLANA